MLTHGLDHIFLAYKLTLPKFDNTGFVGLEVWNVNGVWFSQDYFYFQMIFIFMMWSSIYHLRFSRFWDVMQCSPFKVSDVSEEHVASIFGVKE
jgi:hypothetical protein